MRSHSLSFDDGIGCDKVDSWILILAITNPLCVAIGTNVAMEHRRLLITIRGNMLINLLAISGRTEAE